MRVENTASRSWFLDPLQDAPAGTLARGALGGQPGNPGDYTAVVGQALEIPRLSFVVLGWARPGVDQATVAFRLRDSSPGNPHLATLMIRWAPGPQGQLPEPERQIASLGAGGAMVAGDFSAVVTRSGDTFTIRGETYATALAAAPSADSGAARSAMETSGDGPDSRKRKLEVFQGAGSGAGEEAGVPPLKRPRREGKNPPAGAAGSAGGAPGAGAGAGAGAGSAPEAAPRRIHRRLELCNQSGRTWTLTFTQTTAALQVILFGGTGPVADPVQVEPGAAPVKLRLRPGMTARVLPMDPSAFPEAEFEVTRKKGKAAQTFLWSSGNGVIGRSAPWAKPGAGVRPPSVTIDEERARITLREPEPKAGGSGKNP